MEHANVTLASTGLTESAPPALPIQFGTPARTSACQLPALALGTGTGRPVSARMATKEICGVLVQLSKLAHKTSIWSTGAASAYKVV